MEKTCFGLDWCGEFASDTLLLTPFAMFPCKMHFSAAWVLLISPSGDDIAVEVSIGAPVSAGVPEATPHDGQL
jgi:hypothetical protein